jgi:hypothetical protein
MSEELINQSIARLEPVLQPINGGVGEDISYDENFEKIKSETEKISSLTGEKPNWRRGRRPSPRSSPSRSWAPAASCCRPRAISPG